MIPREIQTITTSSCTTIPQLGFVDNTSIFTKKEIHANRRQSIPKLIRLRLSTNWQEEGQMSKPVCRPAWISLPPWLGGIGTQRQQVSLRMMENQQFRGPEKSRFCSSYHGSSVYYASLDSSPFEERNSNSDSSLKKMKK